METTTIGTDRRPATIRKVALTLAFLAVVSAATVTSTAPAEAQVSQTYSAEARCYDPWGVVQAVTRFTGPAGQWVRARMNVYPVTNGYLDIANWTRSTWQMTQITRTTQGSFALQAGITMQALSVGDGHFVVATEIQRWNGISWGSYEWTWAGLKQYSYGTYVRLPGSACVA